MEKINILKLKGCRRVKCKNKQALVLRPKHEVNKNRV